MKEKKYKEASEYMNKSLSLSNEIGSLDNIKSDYRDLAALDSTQGSFSKALEHYKLFITFRDSLVNTENTKNTVAIQMSYDFNKKQRADSLKFEQEKEIGAIKLQKQTAITYGGFAGIAITIILLFFVYRNYNKQRLANKQLKEAQTQLIKAEKMAAFGTVASRLSHEILNPLNFVNNFSVLSKDLVKEIKSDSSEADKQEAASLLNDNLDKIHEHGQRATAIVKQLQEMSNKGTAGEFFEEKK